MLRHGFLPSLVAAMAKHEGLTQPKVEDLQSFGVEVLSHLSAGTVKHKLEVVEGGGVEVVAAALCAHPHCIDLQRAGCALLTTGVGFYGRSQMPERLLIGVTPISTQP